MLNIQDIRDISFVKHQPSKKTEVRVRASNKNFLKEAERAIRENARKGTGNLKRIRENEAVTTLGGAGLTGVAVTTLAVAGTHAGLVTLLSAFAIVVFGTNTIASGIAWFFEADVRRSLPARDEWRKLEINPSSVPYLQKAHEGLLALEARLKRLKRTERTARAGTAADLNEALQLFSAMFALGRNSRGELLPEAYKSLARATNAIMKLASETRQTQALEPAAQSVSPLGALNDSLEVTEARLKSREDANKTSAELAVKSLKDSIRGAESHMPMVVFLKLKKLEGLLDDLAGRAAKLGIGDSRAFLVSATMDDYLPTAIANYLKVPARERGNVPVFNGKTALEILEGQIERLDAEMRNVAELLRKEETRDLITHEMFLEEKFGDKKIVN